MDGRIRVDDPAIGGVIYIRCRRQGAAQPTTNNVQNTRNFLRRFRTRPRTNRRDGFVQYQGRSEALDSGPELGHVSTSPVVQASGESLVFHRGSQDMGRGTVLQPLHELRRRPLKMSKAFKIGDRIRYTRSFLQIIGAYTGWYPQARGSIIRFQGSLAFIQWENPSGVNDPRAVNVFNLEHCKHRK